MIDGLTNDGAIPAMERLMQFAGQRHRIIVNNIANVSTPGFRPRDVSPEAFQRQLAEAVDHRRAAAQRLEPVAGESMGGTRSELSLASTPQVEVKPDRLELHPEPAADNLLFHDGNDRNVERIMQDLVENFIAFRTAAQFLQSRFELINTAIRERI